MSDSAVTPPFSEPLAIVVVDGRPAREHVLAGVTALMAGATAGHTAVVGAMLYAGAEVDFGSCCTYHYFSQPITRAHAVTYHRVSHAPNIRSND